MSRVPSRKRTPTTVKRTPFETWKTLCNKISHDLLGLDAFNKRDDYDLDKVAPVRFASGQTPRAFVEEMFEDDLARQEHDEQQQIESLEHEEFE